jgi:putative peptidoglycan lipid II flippase
VSVLVPASVAFVVLGREIASLVFARGEVSVEEARFIGTLLGVFAVGLVPFSAYQLQLRAFYAMQDTRTPTFINLGVNAVLVVTDLLLYALLPDDLKVIGLAAGHALSFVAGLVVCSAVLSRRVGGLDVALVVRTAVRCLLAALLPAVAAGLLAALATRLLGDGPLGSAVALAVGGTVLAAGYVLLTRRLRVPEVAEVAGPVLRRVGLG